MNSPDKISSLRPKPVDWLEPLRSDPNLNGFRVIPQATGTESRVIQDIINRQQKGIAKYGTTVADNPLTLRQWLNHAYEETLDQAIYLKRAIEEIDNK